MTMHAFSDDTSLLFEWEPDPSGTGEMFLVVRALEAGVGRVFESQWWRIICKSCIETLRCSGKD